MATVRSDIRTRVRDYIYESTADLVTDAQLNRYISEEVNSLPSKDIYIEDMYTTTLVVDQQDYAVPTGTIKVEDLERNDGTTAQPEWVKLNGWDVYSGSIWLSWRPTTADTIRVKISKAFTAPSDDVTALDVPDDKCEVVVWGVVVRVYKQLIGYFRQSKNWDSISKPDGVTLSSLQSWLRDARTEYQSLLEQYKTVAMPRDIDLVS